jgi:hypothetical protein
VTKGVADGSADAKHVIGAKLEVVLDMVVVNFGAYEYIGKTVPNVVTNASANVFHKVIAAVVEGASTGGDAARGGVGDRKAIAGDAYPGKDIEAQLLSETRLEEHVDVGEKRTVGFADVGIVGALISPRDFGIQAEAVLELDEIAPDADIGAALFSGRLEGDGVIVRGRGHECAAANQDIALLGSGEIDQQDKPTCGCEQRELFQYTPLFALCWPGRYTHMRAAIIRCAWRLLGTRFPGVRKSASRSYQTRDE